MDSGYASTWGFLHGNSLWTLPHVLLAYHAYMYTRNWIGVLCFYYLAKVLQIVAFSLLGLNYWHHFTEILDEDAIRGRANDTSSGAPECVVDYDALFIGGTVQTLVGISIGVVQTYLYVPSSFCEGTFHPVTFWKDLSRKRRPKYAESKEYLERNVDEKDVLLRYGLWPWRLIVGLPPTAASLGGRPDAESLSEHLRRRWRFRSTFWRRWLQLTALGSPALLFYKVESYHHLRAGSVLYGFVTCSLLLLYYRFNQTAFLFKIKGRKTIQSEQTPVSQFLRRSRTLSQRAPKQDARPDLASPFRVPFPGEENRGVLRGRPPALPTRPSRDNDFGDTDEAEASPPGAGRQICILFDTMRYEGIYVCWISTVLVLLTFQAIGWWPSFYKALSALALLTATCLAVYAATERAVGRE
jgi:hypothetical protein